MTLMLFPILIVIVGSSAFAPGPDSRSLLLMDTIVGERYVHATAKFDMSEESGRAWVEAIVDSGGIGDDYDSDTLRAKAQNLSYDTQTQDIVYSDGGFRVVCAKVTLSRFLFTRRP